MLKRRSKWDRALARARSDGATSPAEIKRVAKHYFARLVVGGATISRNMNTGKLTVHRNTNRPNLP